MRRPFCSLWLLLAAIVLAGAASAGEHPWDDKRVYYIIEYQGRLREKGFFVRRPGSYRKMPCIIVDEEKSSYADYDPNILTRSVRIRTITSPEGEAYYRDEEILAGDTGSERIEIFGDEAYFTTTGGYGSPVKLPVPQGALFEISGEWLASRPPQAGRTVHAAIIERDSRAIGQEQVTFRELVSPATKDSPAVWIAEFHTEGRAPMIARFTSDGRLLRLDSEGLVYQVVTRRDYEAGRIPRGMEPALPEYDSPDLAPFTPTPGPTAQAAPLAPAFTMTGGPSIAIGESVPAWDSFGWLVLRATPADAWHASLNTSEYAQIDYAGSYVNITTVRNAPRIDANTVFPMGVPAEIQAYLAPSNFLPAHHPAIIEMARQAIADLTTRIPEPNVLRAVSYLAGWIHQTIAVSEWRGLLPNALDTLAQKSGDSMAHAVLFAAMARSLGIPTRICQGFLAHTGRAVLHCWAEAWIHGGWVPVDTTVSRVGLPAGYVLAERSGPDGRFYNDFAGFMRSPGLTLTLASAGRETPSGRQAELIVGDRRTYAASEGDWMANLYWGFALRLPPSWKGSANLDSVDLTSPDDEASVKWEAMAGDFVAGEQELESVIAGLRGGMRRFKLIDSRIVSFDPEGATPALFIEFTFQQDRRTLRCRQYVLPRRQRAFRISFIGPADRYQDYSPAFDSILATFEF